MTAWRFLVADVRSGLAQHELQLDEVSFTEELNVPGSFSASLPVLQPGSSPLTAADLEPPTAVFVAEKDGLIVWAGPVWTMDYDIEANSLKLAGEGWLSYLRRISLRTTKTYIANPQTFIVRDLLDWAQSQLGGDLLIDTSVIDYSGDTRYRNRTYYHYERKKIGTLIEQLAAVHDGFDFRFAPRWSAGPNSALEVVPQITYPATGRRTDIVFELGGNADVLGMSVDGTQLAYQVDAIGRGEGDDLPIATVSRPDLISSQVLLDDDVAVTDVEDFTVLTSYAQRRLSRGQSLLKVPKLALPVDMLGEFVIGDQVRVRGSYGLFSVDTIYRITGYTVSLPASGPETLQVQCAPLVMFDG